MRIKKETIKTILVIVGILCIILIGLIVVLIIANKPKQEEPIKEDVVIEYEHTLIMIGIN